MLSVDAIQAGILSRVASPNCCRAPSACCPYGMRLLDTMYFSVKKIEMNGDCYPSKAQLNWQQNCCHIGLRLSHAEHLGLRHPRDQLSTDHVYRAKTAAVGPSCGSAYADAAQPEQAAATCNSFHHPCARCPVRDM